MHVHTHTRTPTQIVDDGLDTEHCHWRHEAASGGQPISTATGQLVIWELRNKIRHIRAKRKHAVQVTVGTDDPVTLAAVDYDNPWAMPDGKIRVTVSDIANFGMNFSICIYLKYFVLYDSLYVCNLCICMFFDVVS